MSLNFSSGSEDVVCALIELGAKVNAEDVYKQSVLYKAAYRAWIIFSNFKNGPFLIFEKIL